jgi:pyrroline-5-carboxylate reductase
MKKIILMGCGNIGQSLLRSWCETSFSIVAVDPFVQHLKQDYPFVNFVNSILDVPKDFNEDFLVLAFKPQNLQETISLIKDRQSIIISLLAGVSASFLEKINKRVIRVMPNLAIQTGKSINLTYCNPLIDETQKENFLNLFSFSGIPYFVKSETDIDQLTPIFGSGPAYIFLLAKLLEDLVIELGVPKNDARNLTNQLLEGSLSLIREEKSYEDLILSVASKKGVTEAALKTLKPNFNQILRESIKKANLRIEEMRDENCY